jgi:hypothetical protein
LLALLQDARERPDDDWPQAAAGLVGGPLVLAGLCLAETLLIVARPLGDPPRVEAPDARPTDPTFPSTQPITAGLTAGPALLSRQDVPLARRHPIRTPREGEGQ